MKKLILSIISCLIINNCFAETNIVLNGAGTNSDVKVARYLAQKQIEKEFGKLSKDTIKFKGETRIEEYMYNDTKVTYYDTIYCNFNVQGRELTGNPIFVNRRLTDWFDCSEEMNGDTLKMTCKITDKEIDNIKNALMEEIPYDNEFCENHFRNVFENLTTHKTKEQHGIIFGAITFKEYYDQKGLFYTIDYGKTNWLGEHKAKLFYFGNISKDDFEHRKHQLRKLVY